MDLSNLMQMANQVKEQMKTAQADAARITATGEAGGGMVKVVMNGNHEITEVSIEPAIMQSAEVTLLEDLFRAASNQASVNVKAAMKEQMSEMVSGLGVDLAGLGFPQ
ncbi:MAG: YbaB/EbfC family nucleoid-associated protein [Myxococcota bacterium]|nr:YbaB/EbfC family nucleoid-associated protein [Myxococcota bacterium]